MKIAQQGRISRVGGLAVVVGALLVLTVSAQASTPGNAGTSTAITVQNTLASTFLGVSARHWDVDIPKKAVCRSPFQPPDDPGPLKRPAWGPPPWANGKALGVLKDPPWAKSQAKAAKAR
jgi:hypothetical protein